MRIQEYFKAVDTKRLIAPVVNVSFQDNSTFRVQVLPLGYVQFSESYNQASYASASFACGQVKQARGAIVRHMCLRAATQLSDLKSFTGAPSCGGYS